MAEYALGCIEKDPVSHKHRDTRIKGRLPRHLKMAKLPDWLQRIRIRLHSLDRRLLYRARMKDIDGLARADPSKFREFRAQNNSPRDLSRKDLLLAWHKLCRGRRRGIPIPDRGLLPILQEHDSKVRDSGIRWYTGTFPGMPNAIRATLGPERYRSVKMRLEIGLREKKWSKGVRERTVKALKTVFCGPGWTICR